MKTLFLIMLFSCTALADEAVCLAKAEKAAAQCNARCEAVGNSFENPDPEAQLTCWEKCDAKLEKAQKKCEAKK